ncbi:hypothetical protein THAOC_02835, partial [Thalassiosira oceanica]
GSVPAPAGRRRARHAGRAGRVAPRPVPRLLPLVGDGGGGLEAPHPGRAGGPPRGSEAGHAGPARARARAHCCVCFSGDAFLSLPVPPPFLPCDRVIRLGAEGLPGSSYLRVPPERILDITPKPVNSPDAPPKTLISAEAYSSPTGDTREWIREEWIRNAPEKGNERGSQVREARSVLFLDGAGRLSRNRPRSDGPLLLPSRAAAGWPLGPLLTLINDANDRPPSSRFTRPKAQDPPHRTRNIWGSQDPLRVGGLGVEAKLAQRTTSRRKETKFRGREEMPFKTEEFPTTDRDVVIGRGPMLAPRPVGLVNYRKAVKAHRVLYALCDSDKARVARGIVRAVRTRGGRFIKRDATGYELLEDEGKNGAFEKASQALREKQTALKGQIRAFDEASGGNVIPRKQFSDDEFYQYSLHIFGKVYGEEADEANLPASVKEMIEVSKLEDNLEQQLETLAKKIAKAAKKKDYITAGELQAQYQSLKEGKIEENFSSIAAVPKPNDQGPLAQMPLFGEAKKAALDAMEFKNNAIGDTPEGNVIFRCNYCNWESEIKPAKTKRLKCKKPGCEVYDKLRAVYKVRRKGGNKEVKLAIYAKKTKHWTMVPAPASAKPAAGLDRMDDQGLAGPLDIPAPPAQPGLPAPPIAAPVLALPVPPGVPMNPPFPVDGQDLYGAAPIPVDVPAENPAHYV